MDALNEWWIALQALLIRSYDTPDLADLVC